jgi:hypothetical protein
VNDAVDMNNDDLVLMIRSVLQNNGMLSNNRRKQLIAKGHPTAIIDKAMAVLTECLADDDPGGLIGTDGSRPHVTAR